MAVLPAQILEGGLDRVKEQLAALNNAQAINQLDQEIKSKKKEEINLLDLLKEQIADYSKQLNRLEIELDNQKGFTDPILKEINRVKIHDLLSLLNGLSEKIKSYQSNKQQQIEAVKKNDLSRIKDRNRDRQKTRTENLEELRLAKESLLKQLETKNEICYTETIFNIMERLDQGIEDGVISAAERFLNSALKQLKPKLPRTPTPQALSLIVATLTPEEAYGLTHSSAADSLASEISPKSQNCKAREKILVMALEKLYPKYKNNFYHQEFMNHQQLILEIKWTKYILKPGVPQLEQDPETKEIPNIIMPYTSYLMLYAGKNPDQIPNIQKKGTEETMVKSQKYEVATDDLSSRDYLSKFQLGILGNEDMLYKNRDVDEDINAERNIVNKLQEKKQQYQEALLETITQLDQLTVAQARFLAQIDATKPCSSYNPDGWRCVDPNSYLDLSNLKILTPEVAGELAKFNGRHIFLNGLQNLDPSTAKNLCSKWIHAIYLNGIKKIDFEAAEFLGGRGKCVVPVLNTTVNGSGISSLSLDGLKQISPEVFEVLLRKTFAFGSQLLSLNGLRKFDIALAQKLLLVGEDGKEIELGGIEDINNEVAKLLAQYPHIIYAQNRIIKKIERFYHQY